MNSPSAATVIFAPQSKEFIVIRRTVALSRGRNGCSLIFCNLDVAVRRGASITAASWDDDDRFYGWDNNTRLRLRRQVQ